MQFTEEDLARLADMGVSQDKLEGLKQQMYQAQSLRDAPGPEGRMNGRVYTAAHPLEHIVHGVRGFRAGREAKDLRSQIDTERQASRDSRLAILRGLNGGAAQQQPQADPRAEFMRRYQPSSGGYSA